MAAVLGRVWAWVSPANLYRPWGSKDKAEKTCATDDQMKSRWSLGGLTSWVWGGRKNSVDLSAGEVYWEAVETQKPLEIETMSAVETDTAAPVKPSRWWKRMLPSAYFFRSSTANAVVLRKRKCAGWGDEPWDKDEELSDYGTPPPSPTPLSRQSSMFRVLARTWTGEIVPEHYEICFNFLRHLFDLFVVGFLWTVSPPAKFLLDVLGVQGAMKLWLHGMAMFFVSSVGMAGLLWLVQEYLPQFALVYGIVQALVISVSVRQSVILGTGDGEGCEKQDDEKTNKKEDATEQNESSNGTKGRTVP